MANHDLHLRTAKHFADLAHELAFVIWDKLNKDHDIPRVDPHRFPGLAQTLNEVLLQYIGECEACGAALPCDPWARTGGGAPRLLDRPPICQEHAQRVMAEAGYKIHSLLLDLEKNTHQFLSRNTPARTSFSPSLRDKLHQIIQNDVLTHLLNNIASPCCDECTRLFNLSKDAKAPHAIST
jgi:hypothetical protein